MQHLPIDQVVEHHPTHCARYGGTLPVADAARWVHAHLVLDLRQPDPEQHAREVIQVKHAYCERDCACGHCTPAEPSHIPGDFA